MSRIFFDTNLFIYLIEDEAVRGGKVAQIIERMAERGDELLTSSMTLGEVLVRPIQSNRHDWISRYEELLVGSTVKILDFDSKAARIYANLKAARQIKAPDAIQLACAGASGTDLFVTNDDRLTRFNVQGIQFITSLDRVWL